MIPRLIEKPLETALEETGQIVILLGARQVGKTTILNLLAEKIQLKGKKILYLNCDLEEDLKRLDTTSLTLLEKLTQGHDYLLIDEAQRLANPGLTLKIIHDQLPRIKTLATGSSSLDLKNQLSDSLTGRFLDFTLYPLSLAEIFQKDNSQIDYYLPDALNFGFYPAIHSQKSSAYSRNSSQDKIIALNKIIDSYLFKDILAFQKVRQPQVLKNLSRALAYQIGSELNENEIANRLKIDRKTVINYLDLLEKTFVIIRVFPYSQNPRREIGRNYKIFFVDLGIRNALIGDFNASEIRADAGRLWENFLIMERLKKYAHHAKMINYNFWRSYGGAEVDFLERKPDEQKITAFEFKYGKGHQSKGAKSFEKEYLTSVKLINQGNFKDFIF